MINIKWNNPIKASLPRNDSMADMILIESSKGWDIYISNFTRENKLYTNKFFKDIILLEGYLFYKSNDRLLSFTLYKNDGLKLYSNLGYILQNNKFPIYLIEKINNIINEIEYI